MTDNDRTAPPHRTTYGGDPMVPMDRYLTTRDGVSLFYQVLGQQDPKAPTLVLANGLGGRLYTWTGLCEQFARTHRIITWDYRGLFQSGTPTRRKSLSILRHAEDAIEILDREGVQTASFAGWSMGVQVSLEAAAEFPGRVDRLVLINGTHGHAFQTGFQPLFRVPGLHLLLNSVIELSLAQPVLQTLVRTVAQSKANVSATSFLLGSLRGLKGVKELYRRYVDDVFGVSFPSFLRLFQELNAHSVYHLLPGIEQPTLVISGGLDVLTPAYQSFEIARRMPNTQHMYLPLGSHFVLIEYEDRVRTRIARFLT